MSSNANGIFKFTDSSTSAKSSWFATVESFLKCGAKTLFVEPIKSYNKLKLTDNFTVTGKIFVSRGGTIEIGYADYRICIDNCQIIGEQIFNGHFYFKNMEYTDKYMQGFKNPDIWYAADNVILNPGNFKSADNYFDACMELERFDIDLGGRNVGVAKIRSTGSTSIKKKNIMEDTVQIRNGAIGEVSLLTCPKVLMFNKCDAYKVGTNNEDVYIEGSTVNLSGGVSGNLTCVNSVVTINGDVGKNFTSTNSVLNSLSGINFKGDVGLDKTHFQIANAIDYRFYCSNEKSVFWASHSQIDGEVYCFKCGFYGCTLNGDIHTCPIYDNDNSYYHFSAIFENCIFTADASHILTNNANKTAGQCRVFCTWLNNTFNSLRQAIGVSGMTVQQQCALIDQDEAHHSYTYRGNVGANVMPDRIEKWTTYSVDKDKNWVISLGNVFFFGQKALPNTYMYQLHWPNTAMTLIDGTEVILGRYGGTMRPSYFSTLLYHGSNMLHESSTDTDLAITVTRNA